MVKKKTPGLSSYLDEKVRPVDMWSRDRYGIDTEVSTSSIRGVLKKERGR